MTTFSQRYGHKPVKIKIQINSIDDDLRNNLWNALKISYWDTIEESIGMYGGYYLSDHRNANLQLLCNKLWLNFFKSPLDQLPDEWSKVHDFLRKFFFECTWNEVYDFIEFIAQNHPNDDKNRFFISTCNIFLEREVSAYRFVNKTIARITSEEEIKSIDQALTVKILPVKEHLESALRMLTDRKKSDYRNSIKESISAVEAHVKKVTGSDKGTLGELLTLLEKRKQLHSALKSAFSSLYGYTSDAEGIRHALLDEDQVTFEEAKFMLVTCSAFVNYVSGTLKVQ